MKKDQSGVRGFTLIELLVVIAIIAILAAILFPVFAQAREKARQITCASQEKQIGLATMQYLQDYDSVYPLTDYAGTPSVKGGNGLVTWTWEIQPYIKSWRVFHCPDMGGDPFGMWGSTNPGNYGSQSDDINGVVGAGWYEWMGSYAYNASYLTPNLDCANPNPSADFDNAAGYGASDSQLDAPASTVLATDAKALSVGGGWWPWMYFTSAPADYTAPDSCTDGGWNWGTDGDYYQSGGDPTSATDRVALHHSGGTNVVFCDGHVKWMTPGGLAAGTDWNASKQGGQINITDISQYLWSLKKSGSHDI